MKTKLLTLSLLVCLTYSDKIMAQSMKFSADDLPTKISATDAARISSDLLTTNGFGSVYFHKKDLAELADVKKCVGIRFYVAMEDPKQRFADVIGVAINEEGKEIGDFLERKYHLARPLDAHYPDEFKKMNRSTAKRCVDNLKNGTGRVEPYVAFLGLSSIKTLLDAGNGTTGIRIYSSKVTKNGNEYRTMSFGSVQTSGKTVNDSGPDYFLSNLPCPVDCGDELYLWQR